MYKYRQNPTYKKDEFLINKKLIIFKKQLEIAQITYLCAKSYIFAKKTINTSIL